LVSGSGGYFIRVVVSTDQHIPGVCRKAVLMNLKTGALEHAAPSI